MSENLEQFLNDHFGSRDKARAARDEESLLIKSRRDKFLAEFQRVAAPIIEPVFRKACDFLKSRNYPCIISHKRPHESVTDGYIGLHCSDSQTDQGRQELELETSSPRFSLGVGTQGEEILFTATRLVHRGDLVVKPVKLEEITSEFIGRSVREFIAACFPVDPLAPVQKLIPV